jgi:hypothetical protein
MDLSGIKLSFSGLRDMEGFIVSRKGRKEVAKDAKKKGDKLWMRIRFHTELLGPHLKFKNHLRPLRLLCVLCVKQKK